MTCSYRCTGTAPYCIRQVCRCRNQPMDFPGNITGVVWLKYVCSYAALERITWGQGGKTHFAAVYYSGAVNGKSTHIILSSNIEAGQAVCKASCSCAILRPAHRGRGSSNSWIGPNAPAETADGYRRPSIIRNFSVERGLTFSNSINCQRF